MTHILVSPFSSTILELLGKKHHSLADPQVQIHSWPPLWLKRTHEHGFHSGFALAFSRYCFSASFGTLHFVSRSYSNIKFCLLWLSKKLGSSLTCCRRSSQTYTRSCFWSSIKSYEMSLAQIKFSTLASLILAAYWQSHIMESALCNRLSLKWLWPLKAEVCDMLLSLNT